MSQVDIAQCEKAKNLLSIEKYFVNFCNFHTVLVHLIMLHGKISEKGLKLISLFFFSQWRQLSDSDKQHYEEKAKKMNEENALKAAEEKKLEEQ